MPTLTVDISESLMQAIGQRIERTGEPVAHVVMTALADALEVDHATLFQVSTTSALAKGVFRGAVTVEDLKEHGDFGLGTFNGLDGELVALDGRFFRVDETGSVHEAASEALVPFAVVTDFRAQRPVRIDVVSSFDDLTAQLDRRRTTQNLFYAVRVDGPFTRVKARAIHKTATGTSLVDAAIQQAEFEFRDVLGTLVGFWTPAYARTINVAGWHLHFLTADRTRGGHVLDCQGNGLEAQFDDVADVRIAIPETAAFLSADLSQDLSRDVERAERDR